MRKESYLGKTLSRKAKKEQGFTLIEIIVVVTILAILAGIVMQRLMSRPEQAKIVRAKQDILTIESALSLYNLDNGFYPTTDQGLKALVKKPTSEPIPSSWASGGYLKKLPKDPWGNAYRYSNEDGEIKIFTYGASNEPGEGEISNQEEDKED
jgi:general secretion pathway protein G